MNGRSWQYADLNAIAALEAENFSDPWNHRMLADSFLSGNFYGSLLEEDGAITAYGAAHLHGGGVPQVRKGRQDSRRSSSDRRGKGRKARFFGGARFQCARHVIVPQIRILRIVCALALLCGR